MPVAYWIFGGGYPSSILRSSAIKALILTWIPENTLLKTYIAPENKWLGDDIRRGYANFNLRRIDFSQD